MELKHLTSFVAVAELLSFVRGAERLHLSQPALSGQIQRLEGDLGVRLLWRNRRMVRLTDAGAVFLEEARATLRRAELAADRTQRVARGETGRLRIGFVSSAAIELVPGIVVAFRRQHPNVRLDLLNFRTARQVKLLLANKLDIGFVRLPVGEPELKLRIVGREPFVIVLPKDHRLAGEEHVHLSQLQGDKFVAYGRKWAPGFFDSVIQICIGYGFSPQIVQETGEMYTALALVAAGVGIAILPQSIPLAQSEHVVIKKLPAKIPSSEIAIATRRDAKSSLIRAFLTAAGQRQKAPISSSIA